MRRDRVWLFAYAMLLVSAVPTPAQRVTTVGAGNGPSAVAVN
jgi:hypothetical protein